MLIILQLRGKTRAIDLAREFEVSVRTIYRDIDELSAAGIPIYGDGGPGGGISLLDGFKTKLNGIEDNEASSLFMIGFPHQAKILGLGDSAKNIANKLLLAMPKEKRDKAQAIASKFYFDFSPWYKPQNQPQYLTEIVNALINDFDIEFDYDSWVQVKKWRVLPLGLVHKANEYYLIAQSEKGIIVFKLANISALETHKIRKEKPHFKLEEFWENHLIQFYEKLFISDAKLIIEKSNLAKFSQSPYIKIIAQKDTKELGFSDAIELDIKFDFEDNLVRTILGAGFSIKLKSPGNLIPLLRTAAMKISDHH